MPLAPIVELKVDVKTEDVDRMIQRLEFTLSGLSLQFFLRQRALPWFQERAKLRFGSEGDETSGRWDPLQPATVSRREDAGFGGEHPINRRTGELEDYITNKASRIYYTDFMANLKMPGSNARGELADKVRTAQQGRTYPPTKPRPVLAMDLHDLEVLLLNLNLWIIEHVALEGVDHTSKAVLSL